MYTSEEASVYDAIYQGKKDYAQEGARLHELIQQYKRSEGNSMLDVACGTGLHLDHLKKLYSVEGVDLSEGQLEAARRRHPDLTFTQADMVSLHLGRKFDVVTCLFSSIGYAKTEEAMRRAVAAMTEHLKPGGLLMIEPWIFPEDYRGGTLHADFVNEPELKVARMVVSEKVGVLSIMNMHYMVGRPTGIREFKVLHEMGLFSHDQYMQALKSCGPEVVFEPEGLCGRGLYIGRR